MKKLLLLIFTLTFVVPMVHAQVRDLSGTVTSSEDKLGIPGVAVLEKGSANGTITDQKGHFTIQISEGATIVFSYVGMVSQEWIVTNQSQIEIKLLPDIFGLEEVVVVGYGTQKKSDLTGSVVSIKSEELNSIPTTNVAEMIRGRAPGVEVSLGSARPGGSSNILVRGRNSLSGGNAPLFIVDGIPVEYSAINDMNAMDISSIEVLKDASAQAIYGARASNGVILITTRRGSEGKTIVSYDMQVGLQTFYKNFDVFAPDEWVEFRRQGLRGDASITYPAIDTMQNWADFFPDEMILDDIMLRSWENREFIDWEDLVLKDAWMHQHDLSLRMGNDMSSMAASFGYFDQDGMRPESFYKRGSFRLNFDQKISDWLSLGGSTYITRSKQGRETSNAYFEDFLFLPQLAEPWDEDGELRLYVTRDDRHRNTLYNNRESDRHIVRDRLLLNLFTDIRLAPWINYRLNVSVQSSKSEDKSYLSTKHEKGRQYAEEGGFGGEASVSTTGRFEYLLENIVNIDKDINGIHAFNITLMQGINERRYENLTTTSRNFNNDILGYDGIGSGTVLLAPVNSQTMRRMVSFMGRVRYDFRNKYLITLTGRLDGSSVFSPSNKYGFFPSAAIAWKIHEESFMQSIQPVNMLKLRLSYGSIGNEAIQPYQTQALTQQRPYTYGNGATLVGYLPGREDFPNTDLKWETSTTLNAALDIGLFDGRISGTFEYYYSNTTDLLINKLVPSATGYSTVLTNLGKVRNKGFEVLFKAYMISMANVSWSANLSFSRNENEIVEATVDDQGNPVDDQANRWFIGYPINVSYRYALGGIWQMGEDNALMPDSKPGEVKLKDLNGDGKITPEDDKQISILDPSWIGSVGTNFRLWSFDLDAMFDFKKGGLRDNDLLYNGNYGAFMPVYNALKQPYWTPENPINTHPRPYFDRKNPHKNVLGLQGASYFRLRTLTLGYNFPISLSGRIGISKLRIYLRGTNLLTITKYQSYGPELNARQYPEGKIYSFGLNVSF